MSYNNGYHHDEENQLARALARLGRSIADFLYRIMNDREQDEDENEDDEDE